MRAWVGIEREGAQKGVKTLFIESNRISRTDLPLIRSAARQRSISRIYLGAGKIDVKFISKDWVKKFKDFEVVVETTARNLNFLHFREQFSAIVLRTDIEMSNYKNVVPKIDNGEKVTLYYHGVMNSINTVTDGMYADTDKIIEL